MNQRPRYKTFINRPGLPLEARIAAMAAWGQEAVGFHKRYQINSTLQDQMHKDTLTELTLLHSYDLADTTISTLAKKYGRCAKFGVEKIIVDVDTGEIKNLIRTCRSPACRSCHAKRVVKVVRKLKKELCGSTFSWGEWILPGEADVRRQVKRVRARLKDRIRHSLHCDAMLSVRPQPRVAEIGWDVVVGMVAVGNLPLLFPGILPASSEAEMSRAQLMKRTIMNALRFIPVVETLNFTVNPAATLATLRGVHLATFIHGTERKGI